MNRSESSLSLEKIWRASARDSGTDAPLRNAIKPYQIPELMPDLCIGKLTETGIEVTLAGSNIIGRFSEEITGQDYMQFIDEPQRPFMLALLQEVCHRPVGVCMQMNSKFERGYILNLEVTLLPLLDTDGSPGYAVALSVPAPEKGPSLATPFLGQPIVSDWGGPVEWIDLGAGVPDVDQSTSMA